MRSGNGTAPTGMALYPDQCLLQEAKANYDIFFEPWAEKSAALIKLKDQVQRQGRQGSASPPTRLRWYFRTL